MVVGVGAPDKGCRSALGRPQWGEMVGPGLKGHRQRHEGSRVVHPAMESV